MDGQRFCAIGEAQGLPHPSVNAVLQDREGTVWVGTGFASQGAAARMLPGADRLAPFALPKEWEGKKVRSLFQDTKGRMWIGLEYDGALVFDGRDWKRIAPGRGLAGQEVKVVRQDDDGIFWLGTNGGLTRYDEAIGILEDPIQKNE
jgi:ligand-binding sensor domain-containing protein